jgi:hypothetical protein
MAGSQSLAGLSDTSASRPQRPDDQRRVYTSELPDRNDCQAMATLPRASEAATTLKSECGARVIRSGREARRLAPTVAEYSSKLPSTCAGHTTRTRSPEAAMAGA